MLNIRIKVEKNYEFFSKKKKTILTKKNKRDSCKKEFKI